MANLGALRALAQRMERVVPYRLPTDEANQFRKFAQQKYAPMARKLSDREFDLRMKFSEYDEAEQARVKQLIEQLSHEAARYSMLDHAASSIAKARLYGDEDLRAQLLRDPNGIPGGIVSYYPPSHFPGDPLAHGATYIEHLGATGEPGQGRVLLRGVGLENPEDPLILQSLNYPATTGFYEARGGWRVPYENQQGSALRSMSLPVFKWERGDQVKEKEGGSVKPQKFQVGGLARYFAKNAPKGLSAMSELGTHSTAPRGALSVVKQKGGNWLSGSVEDALRGLQKRPGVTRPAEDPSTFDGVSPAEQATFLRDFALDDWVNKQLTRYTKNEMATPEDPLRALAERGVLHYIPEEGPTLATRRARDAAGFDRQGVGVSPLARGWENTADAGIRTFTAQDILYRSDSIGSPVLKKKVAESMPWIQKLEDKNAPIHDTRTGMYADLGFDHLIDELENALNPESGLPARFQLDPAKLHKVSVPQAVQRVHGINQWRAEQKAEADALRANNAATSLVREYPENNPLGLRWVELKKPEVKLDELTPERVAALTERGSMTPEKRAAIDDALQGSGLSGRKMLEDALKYEGDVMGHCVGGYCDDVASGRSRIFSLRDAKGEPHVTIEVSPESLEQARGINRVHLEDLVGEDKARDLYSEFVRSGSDDLGKFLSDRGGILSPRIVQVKGKQNRAPNAEYLPFVQDFVRNSPLGGSWSDVGDLHNTGMFRVRKGQRWPGFSEEMPEGYYTIEEAEKQAREKGMDEEVLTNWIKRLRSPWPPGME